MKLKKALYSLSAIATVTLCLGAAASPAYASSTSSQQHAQKQHSNNSFQHVYVIMMENEGSPQIIGNPDLPYINTLAQEYGYDDNYYGVTHTSLPNYVAFLTGSNQGSNNDNESQRFNVLNLVDQLEAKHLTWKGYMESMPSVGYTGASADNGLYRLKHDPFQLMTDVLDNPAREQNVVPFTEFKQDLNNNTVPNFSWITPNMVDDMHGGVNNDTQAQLYQAGDNFIKNTVQEIESSKSWKTSKSVIYITWDEAEYPGVTTLTPQSPFVAPGPAAPYVPAGTVAGYNWSGGTFGGGKVPLIMIDNADMHHFTLHTWADHYSLLRTIEQNWGLGFLANAGNPQVTTLPIPGEPVRAPIKPIE